MEPSRECLRLEPETITPRKNRWCARMLHIDGHDTPAVEKAAKLARSQGIPVTCDVDTIYAGFENVLGAVDYLVAELEVQGQWTSERDPAAGAGD